MANLTKEQIKRLNDWARTQPGLRSAFPYTVGSNAPAEGFGTRLSEYGGIIRGEAFYTDSDGEVATQNYVDNAVSGVVTDHGALTGLADDDHPQYRRIQDKSPISAQAFYLLNGGEVASQSYVDAVVVTDHGALTGLLDDDHPQYYKSGEVITGEAFYLKGFQGLGAELSAGRPIGTAGARLRMDGYLQLKASGAPTTPTSASAQIWAQNVASHVTLKYKDNDGVTYDILADRLFLVYNNTGVAISKNKLVYIVSANGGFPSVALADNTDTTKMPAVGITTANIAHGAYGVAQAAGIFGTTTGWDLSSFSAGDILYTSTNGDVTNVQPASGLDQSIGNVTDNTVNGTALVNFTGLDVHLETISDGLNSYNHPRHLHFSDSHFYLSNDADGSPVVNLLVENITTYTSDYNNHFLLMGG